jgi:hypothetical protein
MRVALDSTMKRRQGWLPMTAGIALCANAARLRPAGFGEAAFDRFAT